MNRRNIVNGISEIPSNSIAGNYNGVYNGGMYGYNMIGTPNYDNPNNTFVNNIDKSVMKQQYFDNKIFIDTTYRNTNIDSEPFSFVVKFNGVDPSYKEISVTIDNEIFSYKSYINGDSIVILRNFSNVRSATINALIMPINIKYTQYISDENEYYFDVLTDDDLSPYYSFRAVEGEELDKSLYKYLIMNINELSNGRSYSNNNAINSESFIMKKDNSVSNRNIWIPVHGYVEYFDSRLKNIDRLTVKICDDTGELLRTYVDNKIFNFFNEYKKTITLAKEIISDSELEENQQYDEHEARINLLKARLQSMKTIVDGIGPELHLTINTIEVQINTLPNYRN